MGGGGLKRVGGGGWVENVRRKGGMWEEGRNV